MTLLSACDKQLTMSRTLFSFFLRFQSFSGGNHCKHSMSQILQIVEIAEHILHHYHKFWSMPLARIWCLSPVLLLKGAVSYSISDEDCAVCTHSEQSQQLPFDKKEWHSGWKMFVPNENDNINYEKSDTVSEKSIDIANSKHTMSHFPDTTSALRDIFQQLTKRLSR